MTTSSRGNETVLRQFAQRIPKIYNESFQNENSDHVVGLQEIRHQLEQWSKRLIEEEMMPESAQEIVENLNLEKLSARGCTLMLLDFTPDNVFIYKDSIAFIDPWRQSTYIGSPIPSLGQFIALAKIYELPGISEVVNNLVVTAHEVGEKIGLTAKKAQLQLELGTSLQLLLSAFARRNKNPSQAKAFSQEAYGLIRKITHE